MARQELRIGDVAVFGALWNRDLEWRILTVDRGRALIAARASVAVKPYSRDGVPASWTDCSLRRWLNRVFLSMAFSEEERKKILPVILPEGDRQVLISGGAARDRVFILSREETERYIPVPEDRLLLYHGPIADPCASVTGLMTVSRWWVRGKTEELAGKSCAAFCDADGTFRGYLEAGRPSAAVRPAMWVRLDALRPEDLSACDHLNIRLKECDPGTVTGFVFGCEEQKTVIARYVDYDARSEFALINRGGDEGAGLEPEVVRISADGIVGAAARRKARTLMSLLGKNTLGEAAEILERKRDESRVRAWMSQKAWAPSGEGGGSAPEEGSVIPFGRRRMVVAGKRKPLRWIVLVHSGSKALLIAEKGLRCDTFMHEEDFDRGCDWEDSRIREWLNGEFYLIGFSREEKRMIVRCATETGDEPGHLDGKSAVYDRVFLLSDAEASVFFPSDAARRISGTPDSVSIFSFRHDREKGDWWWLRSAADSPANICCVDPDGAVDRKGCWVHSTVCAVRPAILVDFSKAAKKDPDA